MYGVKTIDKPINTPNVQHEHEAVALNCANEIMDRFNPEQVNEFLKTFKQAVLDRRIYEINESEMKVGYLQQVKDELEKI